MVNHKGEKIRSRSSEIKQFCRSFFLLKGGLIKFKGSMKNILRAILAGYGAKKLGGGCFGTIIVFILLWVLLGQCM